MKLVCLVEVMIQELDQGQTWKAGSVIPEFDILVSKHGGTICKSPNLGVNWDGNQF